MSNQTQIPTEVETNEQDQASSQLIKLMLVILSLVILLLVIIQGKYSVIPSLLSFFRHIFHIKIIIGRLRARRAKRKKSFKMDQVGLLS